MIDYVTNCNGPEILKITGPFPILINNVLIRKSNNKICTKRTKLYNDRSLIETGHVKELYAAYAKGIENMNDNSVEYSSWSAFADDILTAIRKEHVDIFEESFLLTENIGGILQCAKCNHNIHYVILFRSKKIEAYCIGCELAVHG